ncbi:MAG: transcription-repair coupling factor [Chloroflexi bacterium]|nr:transcription-repair coupling factor [Chloroflexota bacterium]
MSISDILDIFDRLPSFGQLVERLEQQAAVPPLALGKGVRPSILSRLYLDRQVPTILLTGRVDAAAAWQQALEMWLPEGTETLRFPEPTPLPYDRGPWGTRSRLGRLQTLTRLMAGQSPQLPAAAAPPLIIVSARAFLQKTLSKRRFLTATRALRLGQILDLEKTVANWTAVGYEAVSVVEAAGQFSRRGGIFDIYPVASPSPIRIELFGDEIETMRYFDPATQRSQSINGSSMTERVVVPPAREALPGAAQAYAQTLGEMEEAADNLPSWQDDIPVMLAGIPSSNLEFYLPLIYPRPASLLDYLPENALLVVDDWGELVTAVRELHDHADQIANEQPSLPPNYPNPLFDWDEMAGELAWQQPLILGEGQDVDAEPFLSGALTESFETGPRYGGQMRPLMTHLKSAQREDDRVVVVSRQASRLAELWREESRGAGERGSGGESVFSSAPSDLRSPLLGSPAFLQGSLAEGFTLVNRADNKILLDLLTDAEIFGWNRPAPRRWRKSAPTAPEAHFADIAAGDYVVHLEYGIGLFKGLVSRAVGGADREYLLVEYNNGDTLYVPVHQADRVSKWIGGSDSTPNVNRLGGKSNWSKAKEKAQRAADELAVELLDLYAARETVPGHAFGKGGEWQAELEASFPYRETEDQLRVIAEVKADMERSQPMDRLVCGDVGYGKTEVALRAAFKAVLDGKQVAILVPTTILAQQHFNTFKDRLTPFPVEVQMLSRFRTPVQQARIVNNVRDGRVDIVIGTHRLLSDDVSFKDLGLVIIDEEQRFGVAHKEKLKKWRTEVDVLTMTATPIPRTLHMSLTGVRDISIIDTAPAERLPVQTYVGEADETRLRRAILRELDRGGQIFFVHNRVQSIEIVRNLIQRLVPEAIIAIGHGQMNERQLERIMVEFAEKKIDILLSTTIIESGLDFPNANTLIVDRAEMFGLAQLYQLRGRVGRGVRRAYSYFFHGPWRSLTSEARARLETIAEQTQLGAGYTIAMRDMEIRGVGDLLGAAQSGQISAVGFDLYTRLLANAVKRRKAEKAGEPIAFDLPEATLIDLPLAAYVPTDYVPDASLRLRLYRRMALLDLMVDIDEMAEELADRFGPIPDPIHNLLYQLRIKSLAQRGGITAVTTENGQVKIRLAGLENINRFHLQRYLGEQARVSKTAVWMSREMSTHEWQVALVQVLEKLQSYDKLKQAGEFENS